MLKKTITYTDFNGTSCTEDFYFNLSRAEIIEMENKEVGGYGEMIKKAIATNNGPTIMSVFKTFILNSYGIKSPDGKRFEKSEEISKAFEQSPAYDALFMELCTDANKAAEFVNSIMPLNEEQKKEIASQAKTISLTKNT